MKYKYYSSGRIDSYAIYSDDEKYRYFLSRVWDYDKHLIRFIGLNPSTATELKNDPTVLRCVNYAKSWGAGGLVMLNIFGYRATNPNNDEIIKDSIDDRELTIAAWGNHGAYLNRGQNVFDLINDEIWCLDVTKDGYPKHPLYLKKDLMPRLFVDQKEVGYI